MHIHFISLCCSNTLHLTMHTCTLTNSKICLVFKCYVKSLVHFYTGMSEVTFSHVHVFIFKFMSQFCLLLLNWKYIIRDWKLFSQQ